MTEVQKVPFDVLTREESVKLRKSLGKVTVPEGTETWMRYVTKDGNVMTQPRVIKRLSGAERAKRESEAKARSDAWKKRVDANAEKRLALEREKLDRMQVKAARSEARIKKALVKAEAKRVKIAQKLNVIEGA